MSSRIRNALRDRCGFTILELLVVIAIIGVLMALLLPALWIVRAGATSTQCTNHLRQIGMTIHQDLSRSAGKAKFSTGDWWPAKYHKAPAKLTETGWVPDMIAGGLNVESMLCPASLARYSESLTLENLATAFDNGSLPSTVTAKDDATLTSFRDLLIKNGLNTNYTQIWYMAHTDMALVSRRTGVDPTDPLDPLNTIGPLSDKSFQQISAQQIMLIADGLPIETLNNEYAKAITAGPLDPADPTCDHDFSAIGLVHGSGGRRGSANILFADGHVENIVDQNADGKLDFKDLQGNAFIKSINAANAER